MSFALCAYVIHRFFDSWTRSYIFWWIPPLPIGPIFWACRYWSKTRSLRGAYEGVSREWERASNFQEKVRESDHAAAFLYALVEFQKAQIFFVLAVQAAALTALSSVGNLFDAQTYQQLVNNADILSLVAVSGCLSTVFVLYILYLSHQGSWFLFNLSTITTLLSTATLNRARNAALRSDVINNSSPNMDQCGGVTPTKYCYAITNVYEYGGAAWFPLIHGASYFQTEGFMTGYSAICFCYFVLLFIFSANLTVFATKQSATLVGGSERDAESECRRQKRSSWFNKLCASTGTPRETALSAAQRWILSRTWWSRYRPEDCRLGLAARILRVDTPERLLRTLAAVILIVFELMFISGFAWALSNLNSYYANQGYFEAAAFPIEQVTTGSFIDDEGPQMPSQWTFGQIIAVTIWAPFVIEWIYASFCEFPPSPSDARVAKSGARNRWLSRGDDRLTGEQGAP